ncbi:DUF4303 domain-containing protein [uncultured Clostridium sp.]|uniref:DUF4303 domain-containing protein n=1 Tax=uncultured Clostridium sp. TaxID=59620 RepID=UPI0028EC396A|nr:DUF4303 domain-containing protein [uncultured Clostridium sp.]
MNFDFKKFKEELILATKNAFLEIIKANKEGIIYAFSLNCSSDVKSIGIIANTKYKLNTIVGESENDFWYYKFCPEEWEIWNGADDEFCRIGNILKAFQEDNKNRISDSETNVYTYFFQEFREKIFDVCIDALLELKEEEFFVNNSKESIELNFWVSEFLDEEESIDIFSKLNNGKIVEEYKEHIAEIL